MFDAEGTDACLQKKRRRQFDINHRKWIDVAHFLGCKVSGQIAVDLKM